MSDTVRIKVENITKIFGDHPDRALRLVQEGASKDEILEKTGQAVGVNDVSFDVFDGETLVIMGLSGSGKSTLIRCINRLIEPTSGKVHIDGTDVTTLIPAALVHFRRQKFGMVFQHFALFPHRSVQRNVEYGLEIQGVASDERTKKARDALSLVGLSGWEEAKPEQLSGGMQQRVGLARALAVDPDILLMDEAFSALDPLIRRDMQHELISLQERVKKTIVFITHDLDEAIIIGDRIIIMKDGAIIQTGTAEDILMRPATDYVAKFVEDMDKTKVLTSRNVMTSARAVAYLSDGPRTVLHKMQEAGLSSIFVVKRDDTLQGLIHADAASESLKRNEKSLEKIIERDIQTAGLEDPINSLYPKLTDTSLPLAVVDENNKLMGVVIKGSLLAGLAEGTEEHGEEPEGGGG